jgi:hypothetical protein
MCFYRVGEWAKLRDGVPESSILIIGISREAAAELGRLFGQIAIVFVERGETVELLFCSL